MSIPDMTNAIMWDFYDDEERWQRVKKKHHRIVEAAVKTLGERPTPQEVEKVMFDLLEVLEWGAETWKGRGQQG